VTDAEIQTAIRRELASFAAASSPSSFALVETAGGVASPGPSGSLQCDVYRTLRLPALLVGDGRLGGISATLSAYESLVLRGHTVPFVALMESSDTLENWKAIQCHVDPSTTVFPLSHCKPPPPHNNSFSMATAAAAGPRGHEIDANFAQWLEESSDQFDRLLTLAAENHARRVASLENAGERAKRYLWWPFTQHGALKSSPTVIDSRDGENFAVFKPSGGIDTKSGPAIESLYDGCASWWTQASNSSYIHLYNLELLFLFVFTFTC